MHETFRFPNDSQPPCNETVPLSAKHHPRLAACLQSGRRGLSGALAAAVILAVFAGAAHAEDRVYWTNASAGITTPSVAGISFAGLGGGGGGDLLTTPAPFVPKGMAFDLAAGRVYWINDSDPAPDTIEWAGLDGTAGGQVNTAGATAPIMGAFGVAIDPVAHRIYWANSLGGKISWANLDGSGGGDVNTTGASFLDDPEGLAVDPAGGRVYWDNTDRGTISYARLDGSGGGDLNTGTATVREPIGIGVDAADGRVYWANSAGNLISYARLDGSGGGDLNTSGAVVSSPEGVAVDAAAGRVYWVNTSGSVASARVDGSGGANLSTTGATTDSPGFPALVEVPRPQAAPVIAGDGTPGSVLTCTPGTWLADDPGAFLFRAPQNTTIQWTVDGADIPGASATTYTPTTTGAYRCRSTATNAVGSATQTSAAVGASAPPPPPPPSLTTITSGPNGFTSAAPTFTFTSITSGATFECAYDGAPFSACDTPLTTYGLAYGAHTFLVRSVSPAGARDPSPASRSFTLGATTGQASCTTLIPWSARVTAAFHPGFVPVRCDLATPDCPADATCTATTSASFADADRYAQWVAPAHLGVIYGLNQCWDPEVAALIPRPTICPDTATGTVPASTPFDAFCDVLWYDITGTGIPNPIEGPDDRRRLSCHVSFTIAPRPSPPAGVSKVLHPPRTTITSGPTGFTSAEPTFTFASLTPGATFECAFDGAPYAPCIAPFSTYALTNGPHTFRVRSVSPAGVRDPSPAARSFTLGPTSGQGNCTAPIAWDPTPAGSPLTIDYCAAAIPLCPSGAKCTAVASAGLADADVNSLYIVVADPIWTDADHLHLVGTVAGPGTRCADPEVAVHDGFARMCPDTESATALGPATPHDVCGASWIPIAGAPVPVRGPDAKRFLTCHVDYTITPAVGLVFSPGIGGVVNVAAPSAGLLAIAATGGGAKSASVGQAITAAKVHHRGAAPPIAPVRIRVSVATPLRIKLKLAPAAAATLRRSKHLALHLTVRFTPTRGAVVVHRQLVTLVAAACTSRRLKPLRPLRPHKLPAGCPTHR